MLNLNDKERMFLQDEKIGEELCIEKYREYSNTATDSELKNLFNKLKEKEVQHLNSLNQMLNGTIPNLNTGGSSQSQNNQNSQNQITSKTTKNINVTSEEYKHDKLLCQDALAGEKYFSSTYNTTIFEMRDTNVRQVLNHIQKEEQEHGEEIYNYMHNHNMYN